jgi:CRISPR-associated endonuclease/helicase Cas3
MSLYPFQKRVYELLKDGRSVILQAPTGAGKTRAALYPFLRAWEEQGEFPRKCIYSVPMRVLANQFWDEYESRTRNFGFRRPLNVTIQTGARPEDPKLQGNLIFATVDQTLSNFLNIPYALSLTQANLNAGAILSSYLVFDELHLFDPEVMLPVTLHVLRLLRRIVPFMVMTATLSQPRIEALAKDLDAEPVVLTAEDAGAIPSQQKMRRLRLVDSELTARAVLEAHRSQAQGRSIAICNTVDRAQALFESICREAGSDVQVRLLHSRFLRRDRDASEQWLRREFGKDKGAYTAKSAILVATQVVEVGLDITSQALHTELAPAASIVQRAGRCARNQHEKGEVFVYRLPSDVTGRPNFAPYLKAERTVCERSLDALLARENAEGTFDFEGELAFVEQAHGDVDQQIVESLRSNRFYIADRITQTIQSQERGAARELIREVDSRTVIVHPDPKSIANPWAYEGFGIHRGSLCRACQGLERLADELEEDWVVMAATPMPEEEGSAHATIWRWDHVDCADVAGVILVAVNPRLAHYSDTVGFCLGIPGDGQWTSPLAERRSRERTFRPYRRETFQEHVERMLRTYDYSFYDVREDREYPALQQEMRYAFRRIEDKFGWPTGSIDRLARLTIALHDTGKLNVRWQSWAREWQQKVSLLRNEDLVLSPGYLAAHTDYDERNENEKKVSQKLSRKRPNHAAEGAAAVMSWMIQQCGDEAMARAALTAIVRHHSAGATGHHGSFVGYARSAEGLAEVLKGLGYEDVDPSSIQWSLSEGELGRRMIRPKREKELMTYLLLARILRLADQRSQVRPS